jgi:hypothetical protein
MLFDLRQLHGDRAHVERTFEAPRSSRRMRTTVSRHRCTLDGRREGERGRVSRRRACLRGSSWNRAVPRAIGLRSMRLSSCDTFRRARTAARRPRGGRGRPDDCVLSRGRRRRHRPLREQFQLALPMKPLCSEACQGCVPCAGPTSIARAASVSPDGKIPARALKGLLDRQKEN